MIEEEIISRLASKTKLADGEYVHRAEFRSALRAVRVPESKQEVLVKLIRGAIDTHELGSEIVDALAEVSKLPGLTEEYRWAKICGKGTEVLACWDLDDHDSVPPAAVGLELQRAIQKAIAKFELKASVRKAYSLQLATFLDRAKGLEGSGQVDSALDIIYDSFDELFRRGQFALCDSVLAETKPENYSTDILLGILTATAPAKAKLGMRRKFFRQIRKLLKVRREYERGLLDGLG